MTRARPDPGAWYEARTTAGTIATALRAYAVEKGKYGDYPPNLTDLGFTKDDIDGKLFSFDDYSLDASYDPNLDPPIRFTVIVTAPREIEKSTSASLDHQGNWKQYP
jgi:hypothetical protein